MEAKQVSQIKNDLLAGLTAGIVALPLALAFGVQSGLGAIYGLYGAMILGMLAAVLGGTNTQVSGPTGPMTVITAMVVMSAIEATGSLAQGMGIIIASFMLAGLILLVFGAMNIGQSIRYMPYPVISGFMSGIGVLIIFYQIYPLLGSVSEKSAIDVVLNIGTALANTNFASLGLGLLTIAIIYLLPKVTKVIPSILVALIVCTLLSVGLQLDVSIIGAIPEGLPEFKVAALYNVSSEHMWLIIEFGATLAALSAIDSLLTAVIADNLTKTKHNSNQELVGQGVGNFISGMFGGLPGAGATMRTVTNINTGGTTKLSGFVHGLFLFFVLLGVGKYVSYIPLSVLAGILFTVGIDIIDYKGIKHIPKVPRTDAFVLVVVLLFTVFGNLLHAVGIGLVMACVLFMKQASDLAESKTHVRELSASSGERQQLIKKVSNQVYIKDVHGPLFFGFTSKFQEMIEDLDDNLKLLILQMDRVPSFDQSGLYALEDVILDLYKKDVVVLLCNVQQQPLSMLQKIDVVPALIPDHHVFESFYECEKWIFDHLEDFDDFEVLVKNLKKHEK